MRRTRIIPVIKQTLIALSLAAILPLTGCTKIRTAIHGILAHFHHHPAAADASPTPPPPPAPVAAQQPAAPAPAPAVAPPPPVSSAPAVTPGVIIDKSASVIVLLYHRFEEHPRPNDTLAITPVEFDKEMAAIKSAGFTVIPLQDFIAWRRGEKNIPSRSCLITIDDGYLSGYDTAWPILKKYGYPFTMFMYIDYIGSGGKSISWDQLAEMRDAGVDIECHTYSHSYLLRPGFGVDATTKARVAKDIATLGKEGWLNKEIVESKKVLQQQLGIRVDAFAYPFGSGSNDPHIRQLVKDAGYDIAFNVYGRRNGYSYPSFDQIGRYAIGGSASPKIFADAMKMVGGGDAGGPVSEPAYAELAVASMVTEPIGGATINNTRPIIRANLATMGPIDPTSVKMRISGLGVVPAKYDPATKTVSYQVTTPLPKDTYFVFLDAILNGKQAETKWSFNIDPAAKPSQPDTTLPAPNP
jgi:peptidoglycan/xylan/chitin deacetylase (PgdA/CDA1 family)